MRNLKVMSVVILSMLLLIAFSGFAYGAIPIVEKLSVDKYPAGIITGKKASAAIDESGSPANVTSVIKWNDYTYWIYDDINNPWPGIMTIVAYDQDGNQILRLDKEGARYLYRITVDPVAKTVTLWGQSSKKITLDWDELIPSTPIVKKMNVNKYPAGITGKKASAASDESGSPANVTSVIKWNDYTFWIYDDLNNPWPGIMTIVAYDQDGNQILRLDKEGARYLYRIAVDPVAKTVTLWGQGNNKITLGWKELVPSTIPIVEKLSVDKYPASITGKKTSAASDQSGSPTNVTSVIKWNDYTYWIYDDINNPWPGIMTIVAYDQDGNQKLRLDKEGARYLYQITIEPVAETVTLWGQSSNKITLDWNELITF